MLLPYRWKWAGIFLALTGIVLAVMYLFFEFSFTIPVFALFSSFIETKVCTTFQTNFADELILFLLITGFGLLLFSKEKQETEILDKLRFQAIFKAMLTNTVCLLFSILFIYGSGFLAVMIFNLISVPFIYLLFFNIAKRKTKTLNK
jgi:hypothetical protein